MLFSSKSKLEKLNAEKDRIYAELRKLRVENGQLHTNIDSLTTKLGYIVSQRDRLAESAKKNFCTHDTYVNSLENELKELNEKNKELNKRYNAQRSASKIFARRLLSISDSPINTKPPSGEIEQVNNKFNKLKKDILLRNLLQSFLLSNCKIFHLMMQPYKCIM